MKLTCREVTRLVLEGEDRRLSAGERIGIRLHLLICQTCPRFVRQVELMRLAMARWRRSAEEDDAGESPPG
jgi:hypothetical protein